MEYQTERSHQVIPTTTLEMSSRWSDKALYYDLIRGTRLGTLGYLPFEIRQEVWKHLFVFEYWRRQYKSLRGKPQGISIPPPSAVPKKSDIPEPLVFWSRASDGIFDLHSCHVRLVQTGVWCRVKGSITKSMKNIRMSSPDLKHEVENIYLSNTKFAFSDPADLTKFCQLLPASHQNCLRTFSLWIGQHPLWTKSEGFTVTLTQMTYFDNVEDWTKSITYLPSNVQSVTIRLGKMYTYDKDEDDLRKDIEKQRSTLCEMGETIRKIVPKATLTIDRESVWVDDPGYDEMIPGYRANLLNATTARSVSNDATEDSIICDMIRRGRGTRTEDIPLDLSRWSPDWEY